MSQETTVQNLKINKLTKEQYEGITTPSATELYFVTDDIGVTADEVLPSQTGNGGKFLTTDGTTASWASVDALPSQTSQSGKFLTTNGSTASWADVPTEIPTQTGNSGKFLTTNGTSVSWASVDALPSQTSQSGKFLTTNGTTASWTTISIPNKISDLTDDTATYPVDKADTLTGLTASITELNYTDGVTSAIQTQLDGKLSTKPDGTNNLIDNNSKVNITYLPDVVLGQMLYAGTFVPSTAVATLSTNAKTILGTTSNTITLTNDTTAITGYAANEGNYYIASGDGTFASISFLTGDWLISTGSGWTKVSNTDAVTGVKGNAESTYRTGNVNITADNVLPSQTSQSGKFLTTNGTTASWTDVPTEIPTQTGNSGKFLTTNGTTASWGDVPTEIPTQTGNSGKFLTTDGTTASWASVDALPSQTSQSGKFLTTNGTTASWADVPAEIPTQSGQSGKFLTTNGSTASWASVDSLPTQTGNSGKFLTTNGSTASWASVGSLPSQSGQSGKVLTTDGTNASWTEQFSRQIGEIVASTIPLTDAGLHLLDGTQLSGSGIYADFVDYIGDLYDSGDYTTIFETEANWQAAVTANGVCGKFVYTAAAGGSPATVRLPLYSNKIYTQSITSTAPVVGNGTALGLTNGTVNGAPMTDTANNALYVSKNGYGANVGDAGTLSAFGAQKYIGVTADATKSGVIADLASITTSLDGYYYIVVATTTKTDIQVDIDEIATDLNAKVDKSTLSEVYPVIEAYNNGNSWYRVYSDGWCEQGSLYYKGTTTAGTATITFLKEFANTNYSFQPVLIHSATNAACYAALEQYPERTTSTTKLTIYSGAFGYAWVACGYIS